MTMLELKNAANLSRIVYNKDEIYEEIAPGVRKQNQPVLYIDNLIKDNECNIGTINIVGGNLKLYSYDFLKKVTEARQNMFDSGSQNSRLAINMENVHWTPYTKLGEGAEYKTENASKYYYAKNNATFELYQFSNKEKWN
jgi:hypothetical protein